jgi:hypothetical protein
VSNSIRLHTFILEDEYNHSPDQITSLATETALRRGDMVGWKNVSIKQLSVKEKIGNTIVYIFEVYGQGLVLEHKDNRLLQLLDKINNPSKA